MKQKTLKQRYSELKKETFAPYVFQLAIVKEYKRDRQSHYNIKYVDIDNKLEKRLCSILKNCISNSNSFEEYKIDGNENEVGEIKGMDYQETDYYKIHKILMGVQPQNALVSSIDELIQAKAYLIITRDKDRIIASGYKIIPENWKLKKTKGLIPLLFKNNRFEDIEDTPVFSISNLIDFMYYQDALFVLSKKNFERGLNFREGMKAKADVFYDSIEELNLIKNIEILKEFVGDNQKYLRKLAVVENLGLYKEPEFIRKVDECSRINHWNVELIDGKFVLDGSNIETLLSLLQNKRLKSEITEEFFDVDSARKVENAT
ncbi:MAG: DUF4868 domain-containing protein [Treponema sp.]|jgi:hypothetical protein|nr:DUF4868 domain-containing protein [Treponema sp.]